MKQFNPPLTILKDKTTYTYVETKTTNNKGERLSEPCYWYESGGVKVPFSKGNIEALINLR